MLSILTLRTDYQMSSNNPYGPPTPPPENPYESQASGYTPPGYTPPTQPSPPPVTGGYEQGYEQISAGFNVAPPPPAPQLPPSQNYGTPSNPTSPQGQLVSENDKLLVYLSYFGGLFFSWIIPLVLFAIAPAGTWQREAQRESLNFQITVFVYYIISGALTVVFIGYILIPLVWIWAVIVAVLAAVATNQGLLYRVPGKINFLK